MKENDKKKLRVFVGPLEIAGIVTGLTQGLKKLNVDAKTILSVKHEFNYSNESNSYLIRVWQKIGVIRFKTPRKNLSKKIALVITHKFFGWIIFLTIVKKFDAFIFTYGQTITNSIFELWILRYLNKKIIFIYVGSDARPPYLDGGRFPGSEIDPIPSALEIFKITKQCKRKILKQESYANFVINSPATAHFHERPYINWFEMGMPKFLSNYSFQKTYMKEAGKPIRILHSPSNSLVKGTNKILELVEKLGKRYEIELIKIQGASNEKVMQELRDCDFVVDQLYSDTPLAGFAAEAAFFGKPAVVGGYFSESMEKYFISNQIPPSLFVSPSKLESAIELLIVNEKLRLDLGMRAQNFVLTQWSLNEVANRYLRLLNDDVPSQWWCDPSSVDYLSGCGLPEERAKQMILSILNKYGSRGLQLEDKPLLKDALIDFAKSNRGQLNA